MRGLPGVHRQQQPPAVPEFRGPLPGHQAVGRRYRHRAQLHHRTVLRAVRQLLRRITARVADRSTALWDEAATA